MRPDRTTLLALALATAALLAGACSSDAGSSAPGADVTAAADAGETPDTAAESAAPEQRLPRLRADGTRIVDEHGAEVVLRGVNLGGWLFHETWITLLAHSLHARAHALAQEAGLTGDLEAVLREVGPSRYAAIFPREDVDGEDGWLDLVEVGLAARVGEAEAEAFVARVRAYLPDIYDDSDKPLILALEERFGAETRHELLDLFQRAWIRESDIAWLAEQGFTVVRVPMSWRELTGGPATDRPTELSWNERAFARLDELLDWCDAHGIYAVLDIQEAPGGQNDYAGEPRLYDDPAMQELTVALWEELSDRFRERNAVAAYSLLAEPYGAPNARTRDEMYDRLVEAIRARGDDHLLVIHDGFMGMASLPDPAEYGWEGVVYSTHIFEWNVKSTEGYRALIDFAYDPPYTAAQARQGVPYYMGSFASIWDEAWAYESAAMMVEWFESRGWSWSSWTYKRIDDPLDDAIWGDRTSWGLRGRLEGSFDRPDVHADDEETLRAKLAAYADLDVRLNEALLEALTIFRRSE